jgi:cytochrome P450
MSNGKVMGSVIDMQDEAGVSALKRAVGSAFATKNLLDYEPDVDYTANILVETLRRRRTVDVFSTMQQFQVDFLMKVAFSKKTDFLTSGKSTLSISGHQRLAHWTRWHSVPWLEALLYKSPLCKAYYRSSGNPPIWTAMAIEELKVRQQQQQQQSSGQMIDKDAQEPGKGVVKTDLLWKYVQGGTRHEDNVLPTEILLKLISSTISAGFDTSAFTMTTILYFLLKNPDSVKNLRDELDAAATNLSDPPRYTETHQMEYLAAVIKESMRHFWFLSTLLEREVPQGGAEVAGRWLPGGTCVAVPAEVVHFDPSIYGEDARDFRPDRWVQADSTQRILMERTMLGFGAGKRVCLGRHIAELEMKKVIPRLLLEFDVSDPRPSSFQDD